MSGEYSNPFSYEAGNNPELDRYSAYSRGAKVAETLIECDYTMLDRLIGERR